MIATDERETLYAMDEAVVMFPHDLAVSASKAKYRGWQELDAVGMVSTRFDPRFTTAHVRWMYRFTDSAFAEMTHRYGDPMTPGAYKVWVVEIDPSWA